MTLHVHVGPTLPAAEVAVRRPDAIVHPPVGHGDLLRHELASGDVVLIVDGYFHHAAAVRHKEILSLLATGVRVVGCSSMGALRAAELDRHGMVGGGVGYERYRDGVLVADDEVAVAHTAGPGFRALSEPLAGIRHLTAEADTRGVVPPDVAASIVAAASKLHYPERSWRGVEEEVCRHRPELRAHFRALARFRDAHPDLADIKAADARATLDGLPRLLGDAPTGVPGWAGPDWRNRHLYEWLAEFSGHSVDGVHVGHADVLRYQQIYHPDFPRRWREYAVRRAGDRSTAPPLPDRALRHWLTAPERAGMLADERTRTVLARSYRAPRRAFDLVAAFPDLVADPDARRAVAESITVNAAVTTKADRHTPDRVRPAALQEHLAVTWGTDPADPAALDAAARDRAFTDAGDATETARRFFLRSYLKRRQPGPRP